jgi:hypothetical protein
MTTVSAARRPRAWLAPALLAVILLLAAALRLVALARAPLWWDEGNNAYFAHATLPELVAMSRATLDTDPPAHRLALKAWLWLLGDGALQLRALSALCGVLGVYLLYVWGRWLYGRPAGLAAATLAAVWPAFVHHSREGKPYTFVLLLAALSVYLWQRYLHGAPRILAPRILAPRILAPRILAPRILAPRILAPRILAPRILAPRWRLLPWLGAVLAAALALGAHYYVGLWMAAQGLGLVAMLAAERCLCREALRRVGRWLSVQLAAVALVAPWAVLTLDTALAGAASLPEVGAPESLRAYVERLLAGLITATADAPDRRLALAAAGCALLLLAVAAGVWTHRRQPATWLLLTLGLAPVALGVVARQWIAFSQPRFLLYVIAPLALLAGAGLVRLGRWALPPALALAAVFALAMPGALEPTYAADGDLRPVAQALVDHARPGDAVVVGYIWQEGILRMRAPDLPVTYHLGWFSQDDLEPALVALLNDHQRLWLLDYHPEQRDQQATAAWWLERNTARILAVQAPPYTLALYADPQPGSQWRAADAASAAEGSRARFEGGVALVRAQAPASAAPDDALLLTLDWAVTADDTPPWVIFVHLVDEGGRLWAQSDGPPEAWLQSFAEATPGEELQSERALLVPPDAPPGAYRLLLGLYDQASGERARVVAGPEAGSNHLVLGVVQVSLPR